MKEINTSIKIEDVFMYAAILAAHYRCPLCNCRLTFDQHNNDCKWKEIDEIVGSIEM